jgi:periplasmic protein TonB
MLAYAANRPSAGKRQSNPNALLVAVSIHVALLAAVMSAKMDLPSHFREPPTIIDLIPAPIPPPTTVKPTVPQRPLQTVDNPKPLGSTPNSSTGPTATPTPIDFSKLFDTSEGSTPTVEPVRQVAPVRHEARLLTPASELKPPYPASKLASEEEAVLTLRLAIDERGRVVAVEPVGPTDRAFLDSARRYLIAHWRYQPATDGDRPVASSVTITLRFELDG